jgi:hypothetical protein
MSYNFDYPKSNDLAGATTCMMFVVEEQKLTVTASSWREK